MNAHHADAHSFPDPIRALVARFNEHRETYQQQTYNETQVRREFIDPFFAALGWDVDNRAGLAEAYKDVIHEDAIKVGGASKAPDYCFRIGGTRKFFVEAKKPAVGVASDPGPAYQVRRYAWTSKLPLSIVTDFDEFAVYDCRIPPKPTDKATVARVLYCTCDEYAEKWPEIAGIFSKDAVLKGSFDKYAESKKRKKGTAEVDAEFLKEIEAWRELLAKNFALRNSDLTVRDLNFAVERTIDRLIFLRMCEDRAIEPYGRLQSLQNGAAVYARLAALFREADDKYNAGLFYFRQEADRGPPDELTLALTLDDKVLKDILKRLYYPESPYEFSVLPTEILGQVYEQFLGKVIRLTAGHRAVIEEKPEVRKAGGVYYTPTYIVDYIVKNTVGKLLEGKTPAEVGPDRETRTGKTKKLPKGAKMLRVLDPACGSGSFLLGAYQYLLDWHRDFYVADQSRDRLYQSHGGNWRLTIREKKRILLNNIYGVDIDPQAVEVTKLSLLLKVLEGETAETLGSTLRLFHERALPDLSNNIKCGNSLIGPDFYEGRQMDMFDDDERRRINVFDWKAEFPDVFAEQNRDRQRAESVQNRDRQRAESVQNRDRQRAESDRVQGPLSDGRGSDQARPGLATPASGFDAVIGNPPYGASINMVEAKYLRDQYQAHSSGIDSYVLFIERAISLTCTDGLASFIVPTGWYTGADFSRIRQHIACVSDPLFFVNLPYDIFKAWVDTTVFVLKKRFRLAAWPRTEPCEVNIKTFPKRHRISSALEIDESTNKVDFSMWFQSGADSYLTFAGVGATSIIQKMEATGRPLSDFADVQRGVTPLNTTDEPTHATSRPAFKGTVRRYTIDLGPRAYVRFDSTIAEPKPEKYFKGPRLLLRELISRQFRLQAVRVSKDFVTNKSMQSILAIHGGPDLSYLLGVINSRLLSWYFLLKSSVAQRDDFPKIVLKESRSLPLPPIDRTTTQGMNSHDRLSTLVDQMLALHKSLAVAKTDHDKTTLQRQIDATDRQIDQLVYQLYGLTPDEIHIVEEATKRHSQ